MALQPLQVSKLSLAITHQPGKAVVETQSYVEQQASNFILGKPLSESTPPDVSLRHSRIGKV